MIVIKVGQGNIRTDHEGYAQLFRFYEIANQLVDQAVSLDFYEINHFDANMSALLAGMVYKLGRENRLRFSTDILYIQTKFDVLIKNGFLFGRREEDRKSTLPIRAFKNTDKKGFIEYIDGNLMMHQGMPALTDLKKEQIKDDLVELFSNINYHANTTYPFFVCGQYYPQSEFLIFTMVDLGVGFLPKIRVMTNGQVDSDQSAILWALRGGNTTKPVHEHVPGGLGIRNIHNYCRENGGRLHIATGEAIWQSEQACSGDHGCRSLPSAFTGASINLFFKHS